MKKELTNNKAWDDPKRYVVGLLPGKGGRFAYARNEGERPHNYLVVEFTYDNDQEYYDTDRYLQNLKLRFERWKKEYARIKTTNEYRNNHKLG